MPEDFSPLKRPGQVQTAELDDVVLAQGVKATAGDLTLEDLTNGQVTLSDLLVGGTPLPVTTQAAILQGYSTGVLEGMVATVNGGDPTAFDVSVGKVNIVDAYNVPTTPTLKQIVYAGTTAEPRTTGGESPQATTTYLGLNASGILVQVAGAPDPTEFRSVSFFAILWHPEGDGNAIVAVSPFGPTGQGAAGDFYDFRTLFSGLRESGLVYIANGANQSLNRTSGVLQAIGAGGFDSAAARKHTSRVAKTGVTLASIYRAYRDATNGLIIDGPTTTWDPGLWDDGSGVLQSFPGADSYGVARGYYGPNGVTILGAPQATYRTKADALAALTAPIEERGTLLQSVPTTWCVFRKDATVFTDPNEAEFFTIPILFRLGGGGVTQSGSPIVVTRTASTVATATHAIRDPATAAVLLEKAGEALKITAAFPGPTDTSSGSFSFVVSVGPLGGALTPVGTVTVLQGLIEGEFVPVSPIPFAAGDAMQVSETAIGGFIVGATPVDQRCTISMRFSET